MFLQLKMAFFFPFLQYSINIKGNPLCWCMPHYLRPKNLATVKSFFPTNSPNVPAVVLPVIGDDHGLPALPASDRAFPVVPAVRWFATSASHTAAAISGSVRPALLAARTDTVFRLTTSPIFEFAPTRFTAYEPSSKVTV